jgi:low affinity Fe/Cu permease
MAGPTRTRRGTPRKPHPPAAEAVLLEAGTPGSSKVSAAERFAHAATTATGSSMAFALATATIVAWAVTGPLFGFSDTWQLVINTGTTIVTFLMVFLIQRAQNKDSIAVQLKLNEVVAALEGSSNRLINVEDLSEQELDTLHTYYRRLAQLAKENGGVTDSHTIEEAEANATAKRERRKRR